MMPKAKRKLLPKDFDALLAAGDMAALKAVFDACDLDARGGFNTQPALAFPACPEELARWLVGQGADIEAADSHGRTPLHHHATSLQGQIGTLLILGADIHAADTEGDTPLHRAAKSANVEAVRALLNQGARADVRNASDLTPLAAGLRCCSNIQIGPIAVIADMVLAAARPRTSGLGDLVRRAFPGARTDCGPIAPQMQDFVRRIGEAFEFHRAGFNPDDLDTTSAALDRLYLLFEVPPVPRRVMHDGSAPIIVRSSRWQDQHRALWAQLVPSQGSALTVQGEVIRIAGRVADEIDRNGGANWDADYGKMARAFLAHIGSRTPLPDAEQHRAARLVAEVRNREGAGDALCELGVQWVKLNPTPAPLSPPDYTR